MFAFSIITLVITNSILQNSKIIKISSFVTQHKLAKKDYQGICNAIAKISTYIRFIAVINKKGELLSFYRRQSLRPMLNAKDTKYQFSHIAKRTDMEAFFDKSLGPVEFEWEERKKVQIISFAIKKHRVWVSIDKKVVRSEVLRIVDSCSPIVRLYSQSQHFVNQFYTNLLYFKVIQRNQNTEQLVFRDLIPYQNNFRDALRPYYSEKL